MAKCPLLPTGDRVVIVAEEVPQKGLILVVAVQDSTRGRVVAVGPDVDYLAVGDRVIHQKFKATIVTVGDEVWTLLRERDCVCKLA